MQYSNLLSAANLGEGPRGPRPPLIMGIAKNHRRKKSRQGKQPPSPLAQGLDLPLIIVNNMHCIIHHCRLGYQLLFRKGAHGSRLDMREQWKSSPSSLKQVQYLNKTVGMKQIVLKCFLMLAEIKIMKSSFLHLY